MSARQRAGQQLSRNIHWGLVWSNIGPKGQGAKLTLLSLDPWKTVSSPEERGCDFCWREQAADNFTDLSRAHVARSERGCQSNGARQHPLSVPAVYHSHVSATTLLRQRHISCFKLLSAVTSSSLTRTWGRSAALAWCSLTAHPYCTSAADGFQRWETAPSTSTELANGGK